jgi:hypothetical protein
MGNLDSGCTSQGYLGDSSLNLHGAISVTRFPLPSGQGTCDGFWAGQPVCCFPLARSLLGAAGAMAALDSAFTQSCLFVLSMTRHWALAVSDIGRRGPIFARDR